MRMYVVVDAPSEAIASRVPLGRRLAGKDQRRAQGLAAASVLDTRFASR